MEYRVNRISEPLPLNADWSAPEWQQAEIIRIDRFRPESSDHQPVTEARLLYSEAGIHGIFRVQDRYVRCVHTQFQDLVCKDSCVEVYFHPRPELGYLNLEMSGNGAAFSQMVGAMRNGGKISLLGLADGPITVDMNTVIGKGLTLQGIYGRRMDNWHQMSYMVQGGLDLSPVLTHRFPYTQFEEGFAAMKSGRSGKVVLDWGK